VQGGVWSTHAAHTSRECVLAGRGLDMLTSVPAVDERADMLLGMRWGLSKCEQAILHDAKAFSKQLSDEEQAQGV
jgi:hypothetical protein